MLHDHGAILAGKKKPRSDVWTPPHAIPEVRHHSSQCMLGNLLPLLWRKLEKVANLKF
jgi:hypothetical protein